MIPPKKVLFQRVSYQPREMEQKRYVICEPKRVSFTNIRKDIAGAILFLCSRAGGYLNGNVLLTDGGRLSIFPASY